MSDQQKEEGSIKIDYSVLVRKSRQMPIIRGSYASLLEDDDSDTNLSDENLMDLGILKPKKADVIRDSDSAALTAETTSFLHEENDKLIEKDRIEAPSYISRQQNYADVRERVTRQEVNKLWCEFFIDVVALSSMVVYVFQIGVAIETVQAPPQAAKNVTSIYDLASTTILNNSGECGIPIRNWLITFFIIFGGRSLFQLFKILVVKKLFAYRGAFDAFRLTFIDGFLIAWLLYGLHEFFSERNDCGSKPQTQLLNLLMTTILALGSITIAVYFAFLIYMPYEIIFGCSQDPKTQQIKSAISSIARVPYGDLLKNDSCCAICLNNYQCKDEVSQLRCQHYFHTKCLENSIRNGHEQCPLCRTDLNLPSEEILEDPEGQRLFLDTYNGRALNLETAY